MKRIMTLILVLLNCITDEKTNCYGETQRKVNRATLGFDSCEAAVFSSIGSGCKNQLCQNINLIACISDYSVYRACKNKSQTKPVSGTGEGIE